MLTGAAAGGPAHKDWYNANERFAARNPDNMHNHEHNHDMVTFTSQILCSAWQRMGTPCICLGIFTRQGEPISWIQCPSPSHAYQINGSPIVTNNYPLWLDMTAADHHSLPGRTFRLAPIVSFLNSTWAISLSLNSIASTWMIRKSTDKQWYS